MRWPAIESERFKSLGINLDRAYDRRVVVGQVAVQIFPAVFRLWYDRISVGSMPLFFHLSRGFFVCGPDQD